MSTIIMAEKTIALYLALWISNSHILLALENS